MKTLLGACLTLGVLSFLLVSGCAPYQPPVCAPNDRSCLPCTNPQTTNPGCEPWIHDVKKPNPDGGTS